MRTLQQICLLSFMLTVLWTNNLRAQVALNPDGESHYVNANGTFQDFVIPESAINSKIRLLLFGADGGKRSVDVWPFNCTLNGGEGALTRVYVSVGNGAGQVKPGHILRMIVGQHGHSRTSSGSLGSGGGGGTAVLLYDPDSPESYEIIAVAGGGGGAAANGVCQGQAGWGGRVGPNGGDGHGPDNGVGGTSGNGGKAGDKTAGGGGAYSGGGGADLDRNCYRGGGEKGGFEGGAGGSYTWDNECNGYDPDKTRQGGFGFGGGGMGWQAGGGGGGYSGGGGGDGDATDFGSGAGGGGGSYTHPDYTFDIFQRAGGGKSTIEDGYIIYDFHCDGTIGDIEESWPQFCDTGNPNATIDVGVNIAGLCDASNYQLKLRKSDYSLVTTTVHNRFTNIPSGSYIVELLLDQIVVDQKNFTVGSYQDNIPPIARCKSKVDAFINEQGEFYDDLPSKIDDGSTDNCGIAKMEFIWSPFPFSRQDETLCEWSRNVNNEGRGFLRVYDRNGNWSQCRTEVTVLDDLAPVAKCKDITVNVDSGEPITVTADQIDDGSYDSNGCFAAKYILRDNAISSSTQLDCSDGPWIDLTLSVQDHSRHGNNITNCTARVTFQDTTAPEVGFCSAIVDLDANGEGELRPEDILFNLYENCTPVEELELELDWVNTEKIFTCDDLRLDAQYGIVELRVKDKAGNWSNSCDVTLYIRDAYDPVVICQDVTVYLDQSGQAELFPGDFIFSATDNCISEAEVISKYFLDGALRNLDCQDLGVQEVTLYGNVPKCSGMLTVLDGAPPVVVCQDITVSINADKTYELGTVDFQNILANSTDNCGLLYEQTVVSSGKTIFDCDDVGQSFELELQASDTEFNGSCTASVTVVDIDYACNNAPVAVCKDVTISVEDQCKAATPSRLIDGGSYDPDGDNFNFFISSDDPVGPGVYSRTLSIRDEYFLHGEPCTAIVTIVDDIAPVMNCQGMIVQLDDTGNGSITAVDVDNGSFDACGIANLSLDNSDFDCSDVGLNTVRLTATDVYGNTNSCEATVTVQDEVAPSAQCKNLSVQLDANGDASVTIAEIDNGSSDACGIANLSLDKISFNCNDVGSNTVTLTATDLNGNSSTCEAIVSVEDEVTPLAQCQNALVTLDANGLGSISTSDIDNGSSDACSIGNLSLDKSAFDCSDVGDNTVTLTVTDINGNSSNCEAMVTVEDNITPTAVCQDVLIQLDANGTASVTAATIDNGSNDACGIANLSLDQSSFTCGDVGNKTLTLTVTDINGNNSNCEATVTVQDEVAPSAQCKNLSVQLDANGDASITVAEIDNGSSDACGIANLSLDKTSFSCADVGDNTITLTVLDNNENATDCQATVTVEDQLVPIAICKDITLDLNAEGFVSILAADIDDGSSDNCAIQSLTATPNSFGRAEIGTNTVELTAVDVNGNNSSCTATVTINPAVIAYVWDDQDGDGKQDNGEPALANASVELIDHSSGSVLQQMLTNTAGEAIFSVGDIGAGQKVKLKFQEKTGHRFSLKDKGNNDLIDSDANRSTGLTSPFTLDTDGLTDKWDGGLWAPGSVQAYVWDDQDGDGKQDAGEPGLSGAKVDLLESNGTLLASMTTDGEGLATFNNVPADRALKLKFYAQPGLRLTLKDQGNNDNIDSDANRSNGMTRTFQANMGSQGFNSWDAGMFSAGTVKAFVWDDQDGDGKQDDGERGIGEARVDLLESDGSLIQSRQTDATGIATFEDVPTDRAVKLQFFEKENHRFTLKDQGNNDQIDSDASRSNGMTSTFQANTGSQTIEQWDAGLWSPGQVQAFVWDDRDGDGKQDEDEPGIKGVEVHLLESDGEIFQTQNSDDTGTITFENVPANRSFRLQYFTLPGFEFTLKDQGNSDNIDSDANRSNGVTGSFQATTGNQTFTTWDAGLWSPGQVEAFVWDDLDGDGKQDDGEPAMSAAQVNLLEQDGTLISSTTTNEWGIATFSNVPADRVVKLQFFEGVDQRFTLKDKGNNDFIDSDANRTTGITGTFQAKQGAQLHDKMDCGLWSQGEMEAFVWNDLDGDGKQDEGEPGLEGVMVDLLESNNEVIVSTSTNADGLAIFFDLPANRALKLRIQAPPGFAITSKDQGNNDFIDSDAKRSTGLTGTFQATMGQELFSKWDAGLITEASTSARALPSGNDSQSPFRELSQEGPIVPLNLEMTAFPNPFSDQVRIQFQIEENQSVQLEVFNIQGQRVKTLYSGQLDAGQQDQVWQGDADNGQQLNGGIYIIKLTVGKEMVHRKVTLAR